VTGSLFVCWCRTDLGTTVKASAQVIDQGQQYRNKCPQHQAVRVPLLKQPEEIRVAKRLLVLPRRPVPFLGSAQHQRVVLLSAGHLQASNRQMVQVIPGRQFSVSEANRPGGSDMPQYTGILSMAQLERLRRSMSCLPR